MIRKLTISTFCSLATLSSVHAATVYTDRDSYVSAVDPNGAQDFNTIDELPFHSEDASVGIFTFRETGLYSVHNGETLTSLVQNPLPWENYQVDGTSFVHMTAGQMDPQTYVAPRIDFTLPLSAFGADFRGIGNLGDNFVTDKKTSLDFYDAADDLIASIDLTMPGGELLYQFWGVDFGAAIASYMIIENPTRWFDVFATDNFTYRFDPLLIDSEVPVPAALPLFIGAAALFGAARRRSTVV
ncbi:VPLPA-CTERM sorting domain-containing protein [Parvularcula maris]|uniref:VPLPA-CTERM sorting domain-containing protein n=1 Tax=Parvularcula maris TaxID=2965077 RepID=A0A9X2L811_9PROT|nr:VPLPA-CTERM sorting domain-containing protein [Parvularcula maris]MCQ8184646.1 VPLPA-CTERM sorting domain-containing protein [Parvularcula maris]